MPALIDLTGQRFGALTVLHRDGSEPWQCAPMAGVAPGEAAGIGKRVSLHTLRHRFATICANIRPIA